MCHIRPKVPMAAPIGRVAVATYGARQRARGGGQIVARLCAEVHWQRRRVYIWGTKACGSGPYWLGNLSGRAHWQRNWGPQWGATTCEGGARSARKFIQRSIGSVARAPYGTRKHSNGVPRRLNVASIAPNGYVVAATFAARQRMRCAVFSRQNITVP